MLRPGVETIARAVRIDAEAKLRRDDNFIADRCECFTNKFLVRERTVRLGRVEERYTALDGGANERDRIVPVSRGAVGGAQTHRAVADGRNHETTGPEFTSLHCFLNVNWATCRCA